MKIWGMTADDVPPAVWLRLNQVRVLGMMRRTRRRPAWFKDTKRSRQRWRHKDGGWVYPARVQELYDLYFEKK